MELPIKVQGVMYCKENAKLEYLIIKRCKKDGGFWQGVTGTLEEGEKLKDCLIREIKEELGITYINNISEIKETIQWAKKTGFIITEYVFLINEAYQLLEKENNKNTLKLINSELNKE